MASEAKSRVETTEERVDKQGQQIDSLKVAFGGMAGQVAFQRTQMERIAEERAAMALQLQHQGHDPG